MSILNAVKHFNKLFRHVGNYNITAVTRKVTTKQTATIIEDVKQDKTNIDASLGSTTAQPGVDILPKVDEIFNTDTIIPSMKRIDLSTASFNEIPGPRILQQIAKIWSFIPAFGNQVTTSTIHYMLSANNLLGSQLNWGRNAFLFRYLLNQYGPVVRLQGPFGGNILIVSRPEDALSVFTSEGRYPIRSSLDSLEKYRLQYRMFKHAGPFLMHGADWEKLRKQIMDSLSKSGIFQFQRIDSVCTSFITKINKIKNRQDEVPASFHEELSKFSLEALCGVILGQKFIFKGDDTSDPVRMVQAFKGATEAIKRCESGLHLWKYIETPAWKKLVLNCDTIDHIFGKCLKTAEDNLKTKKQNNTLVTNDISLLETMLLQDDMASEDILTVFLDMMLIGVNAVTHSIAFLMYHLARSPKAQRILSDEIRTSSPGNSMQEISKMKYLQACIKESLRLKPPIPVLSRILNKDTVISNYHVPKGTAILIATFLSSTREEFFDDAQKFIPERWLNTSENVVQSSIACIPFGYGPKACLAKNLAEMQLSIMIIKILSNFKIEYHYGDINSTNKLLAYPDKPLKFRFIKRNI